MKKILIVALVLIIAISCSKVPFTGRSQAKLIPSNEMNTMSFENYKTFLSENTLSTNQSYIRMVNSVGEKLKNALEAYCKKNNMTNQLTGYEWEFNVIESEQMNAWAMPGGKICFYTGIMPYCKDENGVAVVMGHEIAHIFAKHGNERMTQGMITQMGGIALGVALKDKPEATKELFMGAYGIGSQVGGLLPFSRAHESEGDVIGQYIMAMAGYDPAHAITFWERFKEAGNGEEPPEMLSTHPSHNTRIQGLKDNLAEANKYLPSNDKLK